MPIVLSDEGNSAMLKDRSTVQGLGEQSNIVQVGLYIIDHV